jgi:hypothetical protein
MSMVRVFFKTTQREGFFVLKIVQANSIKDKTLGQA